MINAVISPNRAIAFAVAAFIIYWLLAMFVPAMILRDVFNSLAFGAAVIITATWMPAAVKAMKEEADNGEWQLLLAIFIMWAVILVQRAYVIAFNFFDRPVEWINSAIPGFFPYSFMISGLLFLSAPGVKAGRIGVRSIWAIIAAVAIGALVAGILIGASIPSQ